MRFDKIKERIFFLDNKYKKDLIKLFRTFWQKSYLAQFFELFVPISIIKEQKKEKRKLEWWQIKVDKKSLSIFG